MCSLTQDQNRLENDFFQRFFFSSLPNLNLLLCVYCLKQGDKQKIPNSVHQKGANKPSLLTSTVLDMMEFKNML